MYLELDIYINILLPNIIYKKFKKLKKFKGDYFCFY